MSQRARKRFLKLVFRYADQLSVERIHAMQPCVIFGTPRANQKGSSPKQATARVVFQDASLGVSVVPGYRNATARDSSPASRGVFTERILTVHAAHLRAARTCFIAVTRNNSIPNPSDIINHTSQTFKMAPLHFLELPKFYRSSSSDLKLRSVNEHVDTLWSESAL